MMCLFQLQPLVSSARARKIKYWVSHFYAHLNIPLNIFRNKPALLNIFNIVVGVLDSADTIAKTRLHWPNMRTHRTVAAVFTHSGTNSQCTASHFRPNPMFPLLEPGRADLDPFG